MCFTTFSLNTLSTPLVHSSQHISSSQIYVLLSVTNCCLQCFSICLLQVVKYITMALERSTVIDRIPVVLILSNLQFSTKVPKFGILSQLQLPAHQASLALRKRY